MAKKKTAWVCQDCGAEAARWGGQCTACGAWNTLTEITLASARPSREGAGARARGYAGDEPKLARLSEVDIVHQIQRKTGLDELDRVLGGGLVEGSVVLIGGNPGIGKSTLLIQAMCAMSASARCLYVTGEESLQQVALRARRLGLREDHLQLMTETCVERIMETADRYQPEVMVLDSVQTMYSEALTSAPGSVSQVRDSAAMLVRLAKQRGTSVFIVGHVTKDGSLAGPRVLEHMVDAVLYFEGESDGRYRMIRAYKNRFGTVNELGVFAMTEQGLKPVSNPSAIFLSRPATPAPGSLVAVIREGSRPLLIEVQTLMDEGAGGNPRRVAVGLDSNRLAMLLAVLSRHGGLPIHGMDVFVNIVGGIKVMETATDLAVCLSLVSALRKQALPRDLLVFGEVGLAGEIRPVPNGQERLKEAAKQGFGHALVPEKNQPRQAIPGLRVWPCERLDQALSLVGEIAEASSPAPA